ncbi:MAG: hypothetical protein ACYTEQ_29405 [Planctomycetota bacterium]|jgi:hypothetical protein
MKYKPKTVEAFYWTGRNYAEACSFIGNNVIWENTKLSIDTKDGLLVARSGDWITKDNNGEFRLWNPDVFKSIYEEIEDCPKKILKHKDLNPGCMLIRKSVCGCEFLVVLLSSDIEPGLYGHEKWASFQIGQDVGLFGAQIELFTEHELFKMKYIGQINYDRERTEHTNTEGPSEDKGPD